MRSLLWPIFSSIVLIAFVPLETMAQQTFNQVAGSGGDQSNIGGAKDGGCAFADYDRDGDLDLLVNTNVNTGTTRSYLLRNDNGVFIDVTNTVAPGLKTSLTERSASWGDCNNDGYPDILVNTFDRIKVLRNDAGANFTVILDQTTMTDGMNTEGAGWLDYDNDGDLDFFVECHNFGIDLFNNNGATPTPVFTQVTINAFGVAGSGSGGLGLPEGGSLTGDFASSSDLNADGYVDIIARRENNGTNNGLDQNPYDIFFNQGNGTYAPLTTFNEVADNGNKGGVAAADFDNDGDFDLLWTSASSDGNRAVVYEQNGLNSGTFSLVSNPFRLNNNSLETASDFDGCAVGDIDNDGDMDVFMTQNSGTSKLFLNQTTGQGSFAFRQPGPAWISGAAINYGITISGDGEGCVFVDFDNDGDLDLYVNRNGANNHGWRNNYIGSTAESLTYQNAYLRVIPVYDRGAGLTSPAMNATVRLLDCAGNSIAGIREVGGGDGHGTQQSPWLHFGLKNGADWTYLVEVTFTRNGTTPVVVQRAIRPEDIAPLSLGASTLTLEQTIIIKDTDTDDTLVCVEDCDNGIDDDGDGFIDSYDPDCFTNMVPLCGTTGINDYYGVQATCQYPVPTDPFSLEEIWTTVAPSENTSRTFALAGDLDGDCIPELVFSSNGNEYGNGGDGIIIADGATGLTKTLIPFPAADEFSGTCGISLADVDKDGDGDILLYDRDGAIYRYEWDGTVATQIFRKTTSDATEPLSRLAADGYSALGNYKFSTSIADINHDGIPEMVIGNQVFNAITGVELCAGNTNDPIGSNADRINTSVLVDVIGDSDLDLVVGNGVYLIDIPDGGVYGSGTITLAVDMSAASPDIPDDGYVAVADMDGDGDLDVVSIVGTRMYVWDPGTGTVLNSQNLPGSGDGTSPTIGDVDNVDPDGAGPLTGDMEILFHRDNGIYVVKFNPITYAFSTLASASVSDGSETTISLFDFQGDGQVDILYRDQVNLRMLYYDGTATLQDLVAAVPCASSTAFEHPMAVDITGDGQTELVCDCDGYIKAFGSSNANVPLMPSRKVWNQWSYFVVNINDDLTVPLYQQNHSVNRGINAFWQQLPLWDPVASQPILAAPDVTVSITSIDCDAGSQFGTVNFRVDNNGEGTFAAGCFVSFYSGDPTLGGSIFLGRAELTSVLQETQFETGTIYLDLYPSVDLFAVVNDDGTGALPYGTPPTTHLECDYSNNVDSEDPSLCLPTDSDGDGVPDFIDLDDDNDGIADLIECPELFKPKLLNADFEGLNIISSGLDGGATDVVATSGIWKGDASNIPSWESSDPVNNHLEIWHNSQKASNDAGGVAYSGSQWAEVNATTNDGLYQDVTTTPGDVLQWTFAHRKRTGYIGSAIEDVVSLLIGPSSGPLVSLGNFTSAADATWTLFTGTYTVPPGQTTTRLRFAQVSTASGSPTSGNFVDYVQLFPIPTCPDTDGDGVTDHFDLDSDNDGIYDLIEAGHGEADADLNGVLDGTPATFGTNGLLDALETTADNGILNYTVADSDGDGDIDALELDSDNDGCFDVIEAGYVDQDGDGLLGE